MRTFRPFAVLADEIRKSRYGTGEAERAAFEAHVRDNWTIGDILLADEFTNGAFAETYAQRGEGEFAIEETAAALTADKLAGMKLKWLFSRLREEAFAMIGAHVYAKSGQVPFLEGGEDAARPFMGQTLNALAHLLPATFGRQMERALEDVRAIRAQGEANAATLAGIDATTRATDGKVDALIGRGADFAVKPRRMAQLITEALAKEGNHKGVTLRTVENWVRRLREGAPNGTNPPEGFTLNTLRTLETAAEFAAQYAAGDARRLKVDMAFNEHDSRLEDEAKRRFDKEQEARFNRLDG